MRYMQRFSRAFLAAAVMFSLSTPVFAQTVDDGLTGTERDEVLELVEGFIRANPGLLKEVLERAGENARYSSIGNVDAIAAAVPEQVRAAFLTPDASMTYLNGSGVPDIVVVVDYSCPYCRTLAPLLEELAVRYPDVVIGLRETPFLAPLSLPAAHTGLAIFEQSPKLYQRYHMNLMTRRGPLSLDAIMDAAYEAGADLSAIGDSLTDELIAKPEHNLALLRQAHLFTTPLIISRKKVTAGGVSMVELEYLLKENE
ncbi:DsbA family protein [Thalassospira xianhensis]|uniref:DSBA-like thioredoxin domain-containing protein n=1 Tax=Thalassospira xianhensis MCCC 1A02616 TaxID=1177929 RepID=A0A367UI65_9PROT|nr:DsbA family protein [Thalassospira xianhensis]RCK07869.1 hypothetical protein TH5_02335 [Thalassospira xianhensis MCCC 1A02616]